MLKLLLTMICSLFLGCASAQTPPHQHHDFPPSVMQFHQVMAPLWHAPPGSSRIEATCKNAEQMVTLAKKVETAPMPSPASSPSAWKQATKKLSKASAQLVEQCQAKDRGGVEVGLGTLHQAFHTLVAEIGHRH